MNMIYFATALLILAIILFYVFESSWKFDWIAYISMMVGGLSAITLFAFLVMIPLNRASVLAGIQAHEELRIMNTLPLELSEYEAVAWRTQIADSNKALAKAKYYAKNPMYSVWYPREVLNVKPIR